MSNFHDRKNYWRPCRPGTILSVADSNFHRDRRKFLVRSAMASVVAGIGLFSSIFVLSHGRRQGVTSRSILPQAASPVATTGTAHTASSYPMENRHHQSVAIEAPTVVTTKGDDREFAMTPRRSSCREIKGQLGRYVDAYRRSREHRSPQQRDLMMAFKQHLDHCPGCRVQVAIALRKA